MSRQDQPKTLPSAEPAAGEGYDWSSYFEARRAQPPRDTLLRALTMFDGEPAPDDASARRLAVDLGCGTGADTLEMLRRGWRVHAIDLSAQAIRELAAAAPAGADLTTALARYEDAAWPPCLLLNASFSIPHIDPTAFAGLWRKITASILAGGRFAGQLFGPDDTWASKPDGLTRTYHTRPQVLDLFAGFAIEHLDEVNRPGKDALGNPKHWHVYHIVARKPLTPSIPPVR